MTIVERAKRQGYEFRITGPRDFQYKLPKDRPLDGDLLADIGEHREKVLLELRAQLPKSCAKCGSLDIGPGGILCGRCTVDIARGAFDIPKAPDRWSQHA